MTAPTNPQARPFPVTAALFLAALVATPVGTAARGDRVDGLIRSEMANRGIPGLSLMVVRVGKTLKQAAYGLANISWNVPVSLDTKFQIASATKSFTATAVMLLVQDGKLTLTDSVGGLLPDLPATWSGVTVRQLLTHTSGLPDLAITPGRLPLVADTRDEALKKLPTMPLQGRPGERWSYNQTNYFLLLLIIEKFAGLPFETFMQRRIFDPLGMTATGFGDSRDVIPGRADTYERGDDGRPRARQLTFPTYLRSAAGINTTAKDWSRWTAALASGGLLQSAALADMWQAIRLADGTRFRLGGPTLGYAAGFMKDDRAGHRWVGHSGGGTAAFRILLDDRLSVVMLSNGNSDPDTLIDAVVGLYVPALATGR